MTVLCAYAADVTVALSQMTPGTGSYSYEGTEVVARKNNVYIELPADQIKGEITIYGSSDKPDRFLYIYAEAGTVKDATSLIHQAILLPLSPNRICFSQPPTISSSRNSTTRTKQTNKSFPPLKHSQPFLSTTFLLQQQISQHWYLNIHSFWRILLMQPLRSLSSTSIW